MKAHISCMTGCTKTAAIVLVFFFPFHTVVFKFYLQWLIFLCSAGRCLLITSSCSLMRSACGPGSKAASMTLMWGQETTAAIKGWAKIRYRTYGRHFREENKTGVARKKKRATRVCSVIRLQDLGRTDITWSMVRLSRSLGSYTAAGWGCGCCTPAVSPLRASVCFSW